jgi:hypothetical protein
MMVGMPSTAAHWGRALVRLGGWLLMAAVGCARPSSEKTTHESRPLSLSAAASNTAPVPRPEPRSLFQLDTSAYTATLSADEDGSLYVLTSHAAYRLRAGEPALHWALELGDTPTLSARGIVYWLDGALRMVPKMGGPAEVLAKVPRPPRSLSAARENLAWVEPDASGAILRTLVGSEPRSLYRSSGEIEALALMDDRAYFVERSQERWRLGTVALSGGAPRFTEQYTTRTPALLATAGDVFFYDGPSSTVRRFSSGLEREEVVGRDVICSPLAVSERIYCSQISLLFELPRDGGPARLLAPKRAGTIAALVATKTRLAWLLDVGENRTEVEVLPL